MDPQGHDAACLFVCSQRQHQLDQAQQMTLEVSAALGRRVATKVDADMPAGSYTVRFDAGGLLSGIYVYQIRGQSEKTSRRMTIMR